MCSYILESSSSKLEASFIISLIITLADSCSISLNVPLLLKICLNKLTTSSLLKLSLRWLFSNIFSNQVWNCSLNSFSLYFHSHSADAAIILSKYLLYEVNISQAYKSL